MINDNLHGAVPIYTSSDDLDLIFKVIAVLENQTKHCVLEIQCSFTFYISVCMDKILHTMLLEMLGLVWSMKRNINLAFSCFLGDC